MRSNSFSQTGIASNKLLIIGIGLLAIIVGFYVQTGVNQPTALPEFDKTIILPTAKTVSYPDFINHESEIANKELFLGKWSVVFFGFTNCPDICPTTMQTLKQVKQSLQKETVWENYQTIMVTVDPETDDSERLNSYVTHFDPEFIGLTTDIETTTKFAKQLGILFVKRETEDSNRYEVDHSASIILINPQGQWAGVISAPHKADTIANDLIKLAHYSNKTAQQNQSKPLAATIDSTQTENVNNSSAQKDPLVIENAWIRPAPPNASAMAGYFDIHNNSSETITIVDSHSSAFDMTMIHNTKIEDGIAKMVHLDGLSIPPNSKVTLKPLGTHLMLMRPNDPLNVGDKVTVILEDENENEYEYQIEVKPQPES